MKRSMQPRYRVLAVFVASLWLWAGCSSETTPVAPTTPIAPKPIGLVIEGVPASPSPGQTSQLIAKVRLENGATKLVPDPVWQSSNPSVATISRSGELAVVALGNADITTSSVIVGAAASEHLRVTTTLSGLVHESAPTESTTIAGATVQIVGCETCAPEILTTTTDASGRFTLSGIDALGFAVTIRKPGYDDASFSVNDVNDGERAVPMRPKLRIVAQVVEGIFPEPCDRDGPGTIRSGRTIFVHHTGPVIFKEVHLPGHASGGESFVGLWEGERRINSYWYNCTGSCSQDPANYMLEAGHVYHVEVEVYGGCNQAQDRSYRVVFDHPN